MNIFSTDETDNTDYASCYALAASSHSTLNTKHSTLFSRRSHESHEMAASK